MYMYLAEAYRTVTDADSGTQPLASAERPTIGGIRDWTDLTMRVDQRIGVVRISRAGRPVESHAA